MAGKVTRAEEISTLRNKAVLSALDFILKLADPDCDDVRIRPLAQDYSEERRWREDLRSALLSNAASPLADALRQTDLGFYAGTYAVTARQYLEDLDAIDSARRPE